MAAPTTLRLPMTVYLTAVNGHGMSAWEVLEAHGWHPAVIEAKALKAARRGYADFGVSIRRAWLTDKGRALTLANLNPHIREVFRIAGFDNIFEIEE